MLHPAREKQILRIRSLRLCTHTRLRAAYAFVFVICVFPRVSGCICLCALTAAFVIRAGIHVRVLRKHLRSGGCL